jgi:branched-chain amino acid transport system substrate-binding protein
VRDREKTMMALLRHSQQQRSLSAATPLAAHTVRGVTSIEIIFGMMTDLSSITAVHAVNNINAIRMAFDEANTQGSVHGFAVRRTAEGTS